MKKSATDNETRKTKQLLWFVGIYSASILAVGLFHFLTKFLINYLK